MLSNLHTWIGAPKRPDAKVPAEALAAWLEPEPLAVGAAVQHRLIEEAP